MLCYRCGTHVPDTAEKCPTCGQNLSNGGLRQATGTFSRRRAATSSIEGAPYKPQDLVANRYLIKDIAGAGPLGFVFRAHDKEIDVEVALKVINPKLLQSADERKQFARQIRLARKLSHPNLVRVYEEGEDAERPFFTSQYLDGLTLRKIIDLRLQKGQFFALIEIEPILAQICAALDGAHKVGPHSDLKPDNVLVLPDLLKVTDFGLGLAMPRLPFVQAMKARKSDKYLAPELVEGSEIDSRADIYSVGVILGEMLSGLTPDGAIPELQRRNPEVPAQLEGIYRKAVNSNPNARFKTAGDMMAEISELQRKLAPPAPPKAPRAEPASGVVPAARPRTSTGMLQLSPRRDKPPPPVPEMPLPPPPPPESGENLMPDATQPVDPAQIARALKSESEARKDREETEVIDSGMFVAQLENDDHVETRALVETVAPPPSVIVPPPPVFASAQKQAKKNRTWMLVTLLIVAGVGVGAGGGFFLIQRQRALTNPVVEQPQNDDAARVAAEAAAKEKAAAEAAAIEKAADEKIAADKLAAEKLAAEKLAADKLAADKAAAEKAEADKLAAEKTKNASDEKAAKAEAARLAKEAADREKAEKAAADKAAREAALAEKKAAAEKAAADKAAAKEKAEKEKLLAAASPVVAAGSGGCPEGMRPVAGGAFKMGTAPGDPMMGFDEKALSSVDVSAFCIDAFEYPNKRGASPTASIGFADAKRLCEAQSKRLCSEAEWEKACKGPGGAKWPYGATFDADSCNTEDDIGDARSLAPAGRFSKCRSGYGVADMSGNVAEWTADRIIKGGSFASGDYAVRCSARKNGASFAKSTEVGFRCCADQR
ncbi:MAG: protein kinase [Archangium gephyra]|uniref:non-specific serine/threonine protein kinase n=1 Tax=Archangium gephyra TaxID=48 RepID=A0A2W5TN96_9BACT|nr:MAG: protein kinase [Archangium gephyra]